MIHRSWQRTVMTAHLAAAKRVRRERGVAKEAYSAAFLSGYMTK
jgi:hypothetical protein